jgi:hypothetical protein
MSDDRNRDYDKCPKCGEYLTAHSCPPYTAELLHDPRYPRLDESDRIVFSPEVRELLEAAESTVYWHENDTAYDACPNRLGAAAAKLRALVR